LKQSLNFRQVLLNASYKIMDDNLILEPISDGETSSEEDYDDNVACTNPEIPIDHITVEENWN
jgi:hypothetical protein